MEKWRTYLKAQFKLMQGDLDRGSTISSDQYVVTVKCRTLTNSSIESLKYNGGIIFSDHSSGRLFNHHQVSLRCGETLVGKRLLERETHTLGFKIKSFVLVIMESTNPRNLGIIYRENNRPFVFLVLVLIIKMASQKEQSKPFLILRSII